MRSIQKMRMGSPPHQQISKCKGKTNTLSACYPANIFPSPAGAPPVARQSKVPPCLHQGFGIEDVDSSFTIPHTSFTGTHCSQTDSGYLIIELREIGARHSNRDQGFFLFLFLQRWTPWLLPPPCAQALSLAAGSGEPGSLAKSLCKFL